MPRLNLLSRPQPFIGLLLVSAGWALPHQVGSDAVFDGCASAGNALVLAVSFLGLAVVATGGAYGFLSWQPRHKSGGRSALGLIVAMLALLAGFAVILQIVAGLILPPCYG